MILIGIICTFLGVYVVISGVLEPMSMMDMILHIVVGIGIMGVGWFMSVSSAIEDMRKGGKGG